MNALRPPRRRSWASFGAALLLAVVVAGAAGAAAPPATVLDAASVAAGAAVESWRFHAGDDAAWARAELDDGDWTVVPPGFFRRGEPLPARWEGIGWLRARLDVAPELVGRPLALVLRQRGAAEVFVDGVPLTAVGRPSPRAADTVARTQTAPAVVVFDHPGDHLLAVRFANHDVPRYLRGRPATGVAVSFAPVDEAMAAAVAAAGFRNRALGWFTGLFVAFALLHLLLFAFYPAIRANLDFALLCLALAALVFLMTYRDVQDDPRFYLLSEPGMNLCGLAMGAALLGFVYRVFAAATARWAPRFLRAYLAAALVVAAWSLADPFAATRFVFLLMLTASVEAVRVVAVALVRRQPGARIVGFGIASVATGFGTGLLANLGVLVPANAWTAFLVPFLSVVVLLLSMSVYLSRRFAAVHRDLEARLVEVERLSAETLDQERRLRAEAVERGVLETQYRQKVRELEEARELQLSMLPRELPAVPGLELAAFMETATEVGGDYYDFQVAADGALVAAIGDATGHGMRAGTMVTAAKSLFNALAVEHALVDTLGRSTSAIKRMNLRKLAMALTLLRYRDGELTVAAAGMPPALVHRAASGAVEQVLLGGMPLGAMARFPYRDARVTLAPGDTVLLMSDGFPERLDPDDEMLGYERATAAFAAAVGDDPEGVVARLRETAEAWAAGRPADDDTTFVVLRRSA